MSVLLHTSFEDLDGVPHDVRELSQLISRPLPASLARVEPSTLSSVAQEQLKEVFMQSCGVDCDRQDRELLQDVLNLVLMTSAAMADSARIALDGGERRRTDMFMFPLFRTLARMCHDECSVSGSVPFIWPKGFDADHGVATMLISLVADESTLHLQEIQDSRPDFFFSGATQSSATGGTVERDGDDESDISLSAGDSDVNDAGDDGDDGDDGHDGDDGGDDDETLDNAAEEQSIGDEVLSQPASTDPEDSEGSSNEDDTSEESFQWYADTGRQLYNPEYLQAIRDRHAGITRQEEVLLDLPLYTQILTGQRVWPNVHFPIICLADSSNIVALIASVACQRRVWGIELPVVGLEVSPIGSGVRVHIGWLDPPGDDGRLPIMHTIKPAGNVSGLTAQAAAAQGVFDLANPHSALLFSQFFLALRPQFLGLCDGISAQRLRRLEWRSDYNNAVWTADIEEWANDIDNTEDASIRVSSPSESGTLASGKEDLIEENANSSVQSRRKSCSAFADLKMDPSIAGDASVMTWLLHRLAFLETKFIFDGHVGPPLYKAQDKFEEMCQLYDELMSFRWVKEWKELEDLPAVPASLKALRQELYDQSRQTSEEPWATICMEAKYARILGGKLALLLACADGATVRSSGPAKPLGAEPRHGWDAMLSYFYVGGEDEVTSNNMLPECRLRMPRNLFLDILNGGDAELRGKLSRPLLTWAKRNREVHIHLADIYYREDISSTELEDTTDHEEALFHLCNQTASAGDELLFEYHKLLKTPDFFRDIVQAQAELEPSSGICDAVLFSSLPLGAAGADISRQAQDTYGTDFEVVMGHAPSQQERQYSLGTAEADRRQFKKLDEGLYPLSTSHVDEYLADPLLQYNATMSEYPTPGGPMDIVLPQLIAVYSQPDDSETKALNEAKMYCVTVAEFLAAVGIKCYPVFGLVVRGSVGSVLMAWMADEGTIHVLERNIRQFDLAKPLEAFQFATFLLRLKAREELLKERFDRCRAEFLDNLANGKREHWAMDLCNKDLSEECRMQVLGLS